METLFRDERAAQEERPGESEAALPLGAGEERQAAEPLAQDHPDRPDAPPSRALVLSDVTAPRARPGEALIRLAYRMGVPGHALASPFRRAPAPRVLAVVENAVPGDRARGMALRAGHFYVNGAKLAISEVDFTAQARLSPALERTLHSFSWLADVAACGRRSDNAELAERLARSWLDAHPQPPRSATRSGAWDIENAGLRLIAWLVHAPLVMGSGDAQLRRDLLSAAAQTASWLDRAAPRCGAGLAQAIGWAGVVAAGLLLPEGRPRRLYGEAGLIRALGECVGEDGGLLARCPEAQLQAIAVLCDLVACYEAAGIEVPEALGVMRELLVPPLLALRHGDGSLGSWQGQGAVPAERVAALIAASGVRTRPLSEPHGWGFHRLRGGKTLVQIDAAPPPRARHTRTGCASTLAFEMSDEASRVIVNCGGAALAGGQVPAHIAQGLRASAAHSTLVLDNANSTAVLLHGQLGKGVETVEVEQRALGRSGSRIEAAHDGYAARFGLTHRRILSLSGDGAQLAGEDILVPVSRKGRRGKIGFAIRFHLGRGVEVRLSEDERGASLLLPDGKLWHFRLSGEATGEGQVKLEREDSLWVDGHGRPHATEQLVIEGMTSRGGGQFSWLLKKMA